MTGYCLLIEFISGTLLDDERSLRAFSQTGAKPVAVLLTHQLCLPVHYLQGPLGTGRNTETAAIALLFINPDYFPEMFVVHVYLSFAVCASSLSSFHLSSPRHCRAAAHQSMQEGVFSLYTYCPHFWHFTRISSEKISTSAPQPGHLWREILRLRKS
jgi:hypothetical protein